MRHHTLGLTNVFLIAILVLFCSSAVAEDHHPPVAIQTGFYYTVQEGDTLWNLSRKFMNSPFTWPGLWQKNEQIPNPHWIYPGQRIQLHLRKDIHDPAQTGSQHFFLPEELDTFYLYSRIDQAGFIKKQPVEPSGRIFKAIADKAMIAEGDQVYITENSKTQLTPGDRFFVYRTLPPIKDQHSRAVIGTQHYILGIAEIIKNGSGFALADIIKSFHNIRLNDRIMPYTPQSTRIELTESVKDLDCNIICAEENSRIFGDQTVVFIDKGTESGIQPGQMYHIYYTAKGRLAPEDRHESELTSVDYGTILILRAESTTATALITSAKRAIRSGARVRSL